jgi:hypothetical protein
MSTARAGRTPRPRSRVSRTIRHGAPISGVVVGAAVLVASMPVTLPTAWTGSMRPDWEVSLTDEATGAPTRPGGRVDPTTATQLEELSDPSMLRCRPRGCERWQRPLEDGWRPIAAGSGLLAVVSDVHASTVDEAEGGAAEHRATITELLVLDGTTGGEVFRDRFAVGADAGGHAVSVPSADTRLQVAFTSDAVIVRDDRLLASLSLDGEPRWSRWFTDDREWWLEVAGEHLIVHVDDEPRRRSLEPSARLLVLDPSDGETVWQLEAVHHELTEAEVTLVRHDGAEYLVRNHDLSDGELLWERTTARPPWVLPAVRGAVPISRPAGEGGDVLVDARTGADLVELEGSLVAGIDGPGHRSHLLLDTSSSWSDPEQAADWLDPDRPHDLEVVALDARLRAVWRSSVGGSLQGHVFLAQHGEDVLSIVGDTARGILSTAATLDLATGEHRLRIDAATAGLGSPVNASGLWITPDGDRFTVASEGASVVVTGEAYLVSEDPLVVTDGRTLMGLQLVPEQ